MKDLNSGPATQREDFISVPCRVAYYHPWSFVTGTKRAELVDPSTAVINALLGDQELYYQITPFGLNAEEGLGIDALAEDVNQWAERGKGA